MSPQEVEVEASQSAATIETAVPKTGTQSSSERAAEELKSIHWTDFINPEKQWVLVESGSLGGFFDYVPVKFRVGPWSATAIAYMSALYYLTALAGAYFASDMSHPWWSNNKTTEFEESLEYPAVYSTKWWYNVVTAVWMLYIMYLVVVGPAGWNAWGTYTVQSWTLLWARHVFCAAAPVSALALRAAEWTRFPVACSCTVTFFVWNFLVGPFVYAVGMDTPEKKRGFLKFAFSFRLQQLHSFNFLFCAVNVYWASPRRLLEGIDFYLSIVSVMVYLTFYLGVLDRLGVHLYPVFSPRTGLLVVATWTVAVAAYFGSFVVWRHLMQPHIIS